MLRMDQINLKESWVILKVLPHCTGLNGGFPNSLANYTFPAVEKAIELKAQTSTGHGANTLYLKKNLS